MSTESAKKPFYKDPTHMLYLSVIAAVILGCILGMTVPDFAKELQPIGTGFIALIKMMIAPVIFCTIVLGVGSIAKAATVGKVGGLALLYFVLMSTFALGIGLVVGNIIEPGSSLHYDPQQRNTRFRIRLKDMAVTALSRSCSTSCRLLCFRH